MSAAILLGVLLAVAATGLEGVGQVFLKFAAHKNRKLAWSIAGLAVFAVEAVVYSLALRELPVGIAYPIGALSFVMVTLMSQWWLGETIDRNRWSGLIMIMLGTLLVALSA